MIPHNMTLFKFICVQYQFHRQTLPIMKIDRGQIQFRDYVSTGTETKIMLQLKHHDKKLTKIIKNELSFNSNESYFLFWN